MAPSRAVSALWSWCRTTPQTAIRPTSLLRLSHQILQRSPITKPTFLWTVIGLLQPSMILAESVQTISKGRLIRPMGRLSIPELIRLNYALLYQLDLNEWVWRKEAYERYLRYHR